ncbi:DUF2946 family protein [Pseudomonas wadenswilerensis]
MHRPAGRRQTLAWILYASLLFTLLHCGLGHGQAAGLVLAGVDGAFCSHSGATPAPAPFDHWLGDTLGGGTSLDCPLCSHTGLPALPLLLSGLIGALRVLHSPLPDRPYAAPRHRWPPANPRASPALH